MGERLTRERLLEIAKATPGSKVLAKRRRELRPRSTSPT